MMDFKKVSFFLLTVLLGGISMSCSDCDKQSYIIFWVSNSNLASEPVGKFSIHEYTDNYKIIDFSEIQYFDEDSQIFVLKNESDTSFLGEQYKNAKDSKLFVSIVIDNEVIFTGINGIVFLLTLPSEEYPDYPENKLLVELKQKRYIVISDRLVFQLKEKRNSLDREIKNKILKKLVNNHSPKL